LVKQECIIMTLEQFDFYILVSPFSHIY